MTEQSSPDETANALALWYVGPGQAELRPETVPKPPLGSLRVKAVTSGISRGTESLVFRGLVPESEWQRMRCPNQDGAFPFPVKYGYAMVGTVEDGPADHVGRRVLCLHPHQSRFVIPAEAAIPLPDAVSDERGVLGPQMETALNATWDAGPRIGDRIAVVGAGVIGCLVAYLCARMPATEVTLIDVQPERASVARALEVDFAPPSDALPHGCDVVFHASSSANGLNLAMELAGFEARVVELSWYGAEAVAARFGGAFHSQRLTLMSSQVGAVSADRRSRWTHTRRLATALALCADSRLDVLVRTETPWAEIPAALPAILRRSADLCHRIRY